MSIEEKKAALANKSRAKHEARREEMKRSERFQKMYRCNTEGEEVGYKFDKWYEAEGPNGVRHIWIRRNDDKDPFWMLMVNGTKYRDGYDYKNHDPAFRGLRSHPEKDSSKQLMKVLEGPALVCFFSEITRRKSPNWFDIFAAFAIMTSTSRLQK